MKARLAFACVVTGIGLTALGATTATAEGTNGTFEILPGVVQAGDSVNLSATCDDPDFTVPAPVESGAFVPTSLTGTKGADGVWQLTGTATVKPDVAPGSWSALFQCGDAGNVVVANFKVVAGTEPYAAIGIDDDVIKPGQEVRVAASCQDPKFTRSKIVSPVLTAPDLVRGNGQPVNSVLFAMGKIAADVKPGTYPISFTCVDRDVTGKFTVTAAQVQNAQVPVKPKGAADTGALEEQTASPASNDGSGALLIGAGVAALLAAGGAGVWAHRRRQRV